MYYLLRYYKEQTASGAALQKKENSFLKLKFFTDIFQRI